MSGPKKPKWIESVPQTPLELALKGRTYSHNVLCSASRKRPLGCQGCICIKSMGNLKD